MMRWGALTVALILAATAITGCWDQQEIEERTSVVALALDKAKEGKNLIRVSVQIPIPKKIAGGGATGGGQAGKEAVKLMSATGFTVTEASRNLQKRLNQELFFGHTRVVAVSEELAREGIDVYIDSLRRTPQIRRLLWPVIVKGEAMKLLESNLELEQIPIMYVMDLMNNFAQKGMIPDISLGTFFIQMSESGREPAMNIIQPAKDDVKWTGVAVFEGSKMVGELTPEEVWVLLNIREQKIGGPIAAYCDQAKKKRVVFRPKTVKTKRAFSFEDEKAIVKVNVRLEGDIVESQCNLDFSKQKNIRKVDNQLKRELEKRANQLFDRLQKDFKQDLFGFGIDIRARYPKKWDAKKWEKDFMKAEMRIDYDVLTRRTGMETR